MDPNLFKPVPAISKAGFRCGGACTPVRTRIQTHAHLRTHVEAHGLHACVMLHNLCKRKCAVNRAFLVHLIIPHQQMCAMFDDRAVMFLIFTYPLLLLHAPFHLRQCCNFATYWKMQFRRDVWASHWEWSQPAARRH